MVPNLLVIGVGRSGTSSLYHYLSSHPDVQGSVPKETHVFTPARYGQAVEEVANKYASVFRTDVRTRYRFEATPSYLAGGKAVASCIRAHLGQPKLILSLRDPVDRAVSSFVFLRSIGKISPTFDLTSYIERCLHVTQQRLEADPEFEHFRTVSTGRYSLYLGEWLEFFPSEAIFLIDFARLQEQTTHVVMELFGWLELDPIDASRALGRHNSSVNPRSSVLAWLARHGQGSGLLRHFPRLRARVRHSYFRLNDAGTLAGEAQVRAALKEYYQPWNRRLADLLRQSGFPQLGWLAPPDPEDS